MVSLGRAYSIFTFNSQCDVTPAESHRISSNVISGCSTCLSETTDAPPERIPNRLVNLPTSSGQTEGKRSTQYDLGFLWKTVVSAGITLLEKLQLPNF